jgi:hypothetical protein
MCVVSSIWQSCIFCWNGKLGTVEIYGFVSTWVFKWIAQHTDKRWITYGFVRSTNYAILVIFLPGETFPAEMFVWLRKSERRRSSVYKVRMDNWLKNCLFSKSIWYKEWVFSVPTIGFKISLFITSIRHHPPPPLSPITFANIFFASQQKPEKGREKIHKLEISICSRKTHHGPIYATKTTHKSLLTKRQIDRRGCVTNDEKFVCVYVYGVYLISIYSVDGGNFTFCRKKKTHLKPFIRPTIRPSVQPTNQPTRPNQL